MSGGLIPKRITSRSERSSEEPPQTTIDGRYARPTSSGVYPSTSCRYSADMKKYANMPAAIRTPTTFAVETFRFRKMPSGISGDDTRDSSTRNTTSSTAETPSRPSVWSDVQPSSLPFTIA